MSSLSKSELKEFRRKLRALLPNQINDLEMNDVVFAVSPMVTRVLAPGEFQPGCSLGQIAKSIFSVTDRLKVVEFYNGVVFKGSFPDINGNFASWRKTHMQRAFTIVKCLVQDAYVFGYKKPIDLEQQVLRWFLLDVVGVSIKNLKTHLVWLSGRQRRVDSPTEGLVDLPGMLMDVPYRTFLLQRLRSRQKCTVEFTKAEILSETLLLGTKRGFPSMEDEYIEKEKENLKRDLSRVVKSNPLILDEIHRTALEVFAKAPREVGGNFEISHRAGWEAPIKEGGILGHLVRRFEWDKLDIQLLKMVVSRAEPTRIRSYYGIPLSTWDFYEDTKRDWTFRNGNGERARCVIYAIREPLKVRLITAGTPDLYGACKPVQRAMWQALQRHLTFELTGSEVTETLLETVLNRCPEYSWWDMFCSGDFKASTNNIHADCTEVAVDAWCGGDIAMKNFVMSALGEQWLYADKKDENPVLQTYGQLMGSPLSFPILCVINAAIARMAYERSTGRSFKLKELPFLVNGDDFLARMDHKTYKWWDFLISEVGWEQSLGKSYFLSDYVQINSQTRKVYRQKDMYYFSRRIPFVNDGFLNQMKKATFQIDSTPLEAMSFKWSKQYEEVKALPGVLGRRAAEILLSNLNDVLTYLHNEGLTPYRLNLYNPVILGGLGIMSDDSTNWDWGLANKSLRYKPVRTGKITRELIRGWDDNTFALANASQTKAPLENKSGTFFESVQSPPRSVLDFLIDDLESWVSERAMPQANEPGCLFISQVEGVDSLRTPLYSNEQLAWDPLKDDLSVYIL